MSPQDRLAAVLDEIRARRDRRLLNPPTSPAAMRAAIESAGDVPRLVGAIENVLELADELAALAGPGDWGEDPASTVQADTGRAFRAAVSAALAAGGERS